MARVERLSVVEVAVLAVAPGSRFQSDPASWCRRRVGYRQRNCSEVDQEGKAARNLVIERQGCSPIVRSAKSRPLSYRTSASPY